MYRLKSFCFVRLARYFDRHAACDRKEVIKMEELFILSLASYPSVRDHVLISYFAESVEQDQPSNVLLLYKAPSSVI